MFQFTRCPSHSLCVQKWITRHYPRWVSPFGNLRIIAFVLLPVAYRCLHVLLRQLVPRHSSHTLCSFYFLVLILMRSSSLGAFNAQSTYLYTVFKMLSPLWARRSTSVALADWNDTMTHPRLQGPNGIFGRSGLLAQPVTRLELTKRPFEPQNSHAGKSWRSLKWVRVFQDPRPILAKTR